MKDILKLVAVLLVMTGIAYGLYVFAKGIDKRQPQEVEQTE